MAGELAAAVRLSDEQMVLAEISPALGLATIGLSTADSFHQRIPIMTDLGQWNLALGMAIIATSFAFATKWE